MSISFSFVHVCESQIVAFPSLVKDTKSFPSGAMAKAIASPGWTYPEADSSSQTITMHLTIDATNSRFGLMNANDIKPSGTLKTCVELWAVSVDQRRTFP
jgi:hypothetical protein